MRGNGILTALLLVILPAAGLGSASANAAQRRRGSSVTAVVPPPSRTATPKVEGPRDSSLPLVVIDAGHGGHDPGAISAFEGRHEKTAVLAIAREIRDQLVKSGRVRVALTRGNDRFLALGERVAVARRLDADLFISIHADSAPSPDANGASVYTLSEIASDRDAARVAAKENRSDMVRGVDLGGDADIQSILFDLARRETMNASASFAAVLRRETPDEVRFRTQAHRFANFRVLKAGDIPSVLFETGYLSNEEDARFLFSEQGREAIAKGVRRAVEAHFARRLGRR